MKYNIKSKILLGLLLSFTALSLSCKQEVISSNSSIISESAALELDTKIYADGISPIYCRDIDEKNFKAKLNQPIDLVVSKDGKKVYVLNKRKLLFGEIKDYNAPPSPNPYFMTLIERQFIYEIKDDKSISIVKTDNHYPYSCQLSEEIAIDSKDNIYVTKPVIAKNNYLSYSNYRLITQFITAHKIYKISPEKSISEYKEAKLYEPTNPLIDFRPDKEPRDLKNLYISNDDQLYFQIITGDEGYV